MQEKIRDQVDKLFIISLATLLLFIAGCTVDNAAEEGVSSELPIGVEVAVAEELPVEIVEETAVSTPITETVPVDNCLDCHINKEMLIDTAEPVVEVISESEGEG